MKIKIHHILLTMSLSTSLYATEFNAIEISSNKNHLIKEAQDNAIQYLDMRAIQNFEDKKNQHIKSFLSELDGMININAWVLGIVANQKNIQLLVEKYNTTLLHDFSYQTFKLIGKDPYYVSYMFSTLYRNSFVSDLADAFANEYNKNGAEIYISTGDKIDKNSIMFLPLAI